MILDLTPSLAVKLASIVVHAEEATGPGGHSYDMHTIKGLSEDPEVRAWLESFDEALLPKKRA
jgi:hypothetical protein